MANPILECINLSGKTIYAFLVNRLNGQVWNTNSSAFEAFNASNWADYAVALAEFTGSGYYWAARPTGVATYLVSDVFFVQAGGSPASGDAPAFIVSHNEGENVAAINADPAAAPQNLAAALGSEVQGAVASGTISNTSFPTNLTGASDNLYVGRLCYFLTGSLAKSYGTIQAYDHSTAVLTVTALIAAPAVGDTFIIV